MERICPFSSRSGRAAAGCARTCSCISAGQQYLAVRVVDDGLFHNRGADDVVHLLCHHHGLTEIFLTVLKRYLMYSLILADIRAFQHSSINIILRIPFSRRILAMKVSMMISVTTGRSTLLLLILSSSNTMNRLSGPVPCRSSAGSHSRRPVERFQNVQKPSMSKSFSRTFFSSIIRR